MTKPLVQLDTDSLPKLEVLPESGMGYYVVRGRLGKESEERVYIISARFVVPVCHDSYFSLRDMVKGETFPSEIGETLTMTITGPVLRRARVSPPPGYLPCAGALPLFGQTTLTGTTLFYRFGSAPSDPRFKGGNLLLSGTYLTTANDHGYANTGFAAVGRYALPLPVPASHLFPYQLPPGTPLLIGTVPPNYGQAGGGVEVQLQSAAPATALRPLNLDDY